jgi:glycosyltransferase involved in cell wall biosynthesis
VSDIMTGTDKRPRLLFISTMFLQPVDTGARIRTTQILRGLRGGRFHVTLASPATAAEIASHRAEMEALADEYHWWPVGERDAAFHLLRMRHLLSPLPIPVCTDRSAAGCARVRELLARRPDVIVADFPHAMVLLPPGPPPAPVVVFTHNVEAEIFARHRDVSRDPLRRWIWENQRRKMARYEGEVLRRADGVVAVAERDARAFTVEYGIPPAGVIPTGVDLDYFTWRAPTARPAVVFTGSMDWMANQDGIRFFLDEVWPRVLAGEPAATMTVVGRSPPEDLVAAARERGYAWTFTGRVPDTRPFVHEAAAFVIPLRVGGGTRLKVYEAMAMGCPVVSTHLGVEGLPVEDGKHCLLADDAEGLANALLRLFREPSLGHRLSRQARDHVEAHFSFRRAAAVFEEICVEALERYRERGGLRGSDGAPPTRT